MSEAPSVVQLAQRHPELNVIGLGAQDSVELANGFIERTNTGDAGLTMVWDPSFDTWRTFGIRSQPYWILFDAQGNELFSRPGIIDFEAIDAAL